MNLVKWFRKNNTKVMAVVVIVLMVGFIGGSALTYLLRPRGGEKDTVAYYGDHRKIHYRDRDLARQELEILNRLGVPQLLQRQDVSGLLLDELLFANERSGSSGDLISAAQRAVQQYGYRISNRQLASLKQSEVSPEILWLLLREEAQASGIYFRPEEAGQILARWLQPQNGGPGYAQGVGALMRQYKVPEGEILDAFGKFMAVLEYAGFACSTENLTTAQLKHLVSWEGEALNADFVPFKASDFVDKQMTPSEPNMAAQFAQYKGFPAGDISEANPFGFGYKLPDRVQAEYLVLKLDDVQSIIKKPTQQEAESYYQQNRATQYTQQERSDPNDPNSPMVAKVQSYSEVADTILKQLARDKIAAKAEQILTEAKNIADANLPTIASASSRDGNEPNVATLRMLAGDYARIAQEMSRKYGIPVFSGRTGMISAADVVNDKQLSRLRLVTTGASPVGLAQVLFSVRELGDHATVPLTTPNAEVFRTIGPLRDTYVTVVTANMPSQIMAVARVISAEKAAEPANLDVTYSRKTLDLGGNSAADANSVYSVREQVAKDVKLLAAWDKTKAKAQELVELASKDGWDKAVSQFNDLYGKQMKKDPNDPNVFRLDHRQGIQRISEAQVEIYTAQLSNAPNAQSVLTRLQTERRLAERLFSLVPADANSAPKMPAVMEFKPGQTFYALKDITVQRLNQQQFQETKNVAAYRSDHVETQSLAMVHLEPQNIVKRMNFKYVEDKNRRPIAPPMEPEDEF